MNKLLAMLTMTTMMGCANEPAAESQGLEGTYDFVLESSDVAPKLRAKCAGEEACWRDIRAEADREKIRFTRTATGLLYTSFEIEGGKETIHFEAPADLARVVRRVDGTIAIKDDEKGLLVFRRAP